MRKLLSAGTVVLTVVLSLLICCTGGPIAAAEMIDHPDCCEKQCARNDLPTPTAVLSPEQRGDELRVSVVAVLTTTFDHEHAVSAAHEVASFATPQLFDPITTVQLRI